MIIWAFIIYMGGIFGVSDNTSFFRVIFWPYYLGKRLGAEAEKAMPTKRGNAR